MLDRYVLNENGEPVPAADLLSWGEWFGKQQRILARTQIGDAEVSTVFLGIDHRFGGEGPPILWETMVFGGTLDSEMCRYSSKASALAGHAAMVARVKELQS